jgi:hypothetical protein
MRSRLLARCCFAILLSLVAGWLSSCNGSPPSPAPSSHRTANIDEISVYWDEIKRALPPRPLSPQDQAQSAWVVQAIRIENPLFWKMCDKPDPAGRLDLYVSRLGSDAPRADLAWLLADPAGLIPFRHVVELGGEGQGTAAQQELRAGLLQIQRLLCEAEVNRCLAGRAFLERYYRAVLWSGMFLRDNRLAAQHGAHDTQLGDLVFAVGQLRKGLPPLTDKDFWCYARHFVLLAHATGRDDLLTNASATDLRTRCQQWYEWLGGDHWVEGNDPRLIHMQPDTQSLVWHFVPGWRGPAPFNPIPIPDRPFADGQLPVPNEDFTSWAADNCWGTLPPESAVIAQRIGRDCSRAAN